MTKNIVSWENVIKQIYSMNLDRQLELIAYIANKIQQYKSSPNKKNSLKSIIGSGKGCFATPEEADNFINQERDKWEFEKQLQEHEFIYILISLFTQYKGMLNFKIY